MNIKTDIAILGAGPAGLSAAYHLKGESLLIEKEDRVGGLARSKEIRGFVFDYAGHIFFTQDKYAFKLFKKLLKNNINFRNRDAWVYSKNIYTRYPFQANTYGLPKDVIMDCIIGLINATLRQAQDNGNGRMPRHFEEWMDATFGEGIVKHFMKPYNQKVWAFPLNKMTYEWIADRVMMPDVKEVIEGAVESRKVEFGPNSTFAYPLKGGSQAFADSFIPYLKRTEILLNSEVVALDLKEKVITVKSGVGSRESGVRNKREIEYEKVISSLPLPQLISLCNKVPKNVKKAAEELEFTSVYCVNLGINHPEITEKNWIYYPEKNVIFQRLFVQSNASPYVVPKGKSSITAEISYSKFKRIGKEGLIERVIDDLVRIKFIKKASDIVVSDLLDIKYGYIIFEKGRKRKVDIIHRFLRENDIIPIGRFGEWEYYNMDHSILSGKMGAEESLLLDK
ncbi:MAG: FAD-dependent oxidoreductase [Nitrospinae bacterium]|nr:FAD-dependent oxidoreductase [Nitrospinota bacterium]